MARNIFNRPRIAFDRQREMEPCRLRRGWVRLIFSAFILAGFPIRGLGLLFLGGFQLGEIFLRLLVEILQATLAAEFHGHPFMHMHTQGNKH